MELRDETQTLYIFNYVGGTMKLKKYLFMFLFLGITILALSTITHDAQATTSGSVYSGHGNWAVTTPTVYNGEALIVRGNIDITGSGTLTLIGTHLTMDVPTGSSRYINVAVAGGSSWMKVQQSSIMDTTNFTMGINNVEITADNNGRVQLDNSTFLHYWLYNTGMMTCNYNNSTFDSCYISNYFARSITMYGDIWRNSNINHAIQLGWSSTISHCSFYGWTLPGTSTAYSLIYSFYSNHININNNTWAMSSYPIININGNPPTYTMTNISFANNVINGTSGSDGMDTCFFDTGSISSNINIYGNLIKNTVNGNTFLIQSNCHIYNNIFQIINASTMASGASSGIFINAGAFNNSINNNIFKYITGPTSDIGVTSNGIFSYSSGNFTAEYNNFWNVNKISNGICVSTGYGTNIVIQHNIFGNISYASDGIGLYGGKNAIIRYNTISSVDLSSCGIRLAYRGTNANVYGNSILSFNNISNNYQMSSGAYSINGETYGITNALFANNTVGWVGTAYYPCYNITGPSVSVIIFPLGQESIVFKNAALTIIHIERITLRDITLNTHYIYDVGINIPSYAPSSSSHIIYVISSSANPIISVVSHHVGYQLINMIFPASSDQSILNWSLSTTASWIHQYPNGTLYGQPGLSSIGMWNYTVYATNYNGTANYSDFVYIPNTLGYPIVQGGPDYTNIALVILFMGLITIFNFYGHREKMLVIQLIAIVIMLPGVVWAFLIMPGTWEIPLLFIMVNLVIFVMDAARGRN
jgi:hypothetical protein